MDVSIVIVCYNSAGYISRCVDSIYRETQNTLFEIIVVDNASTDGSIIQIREQYPEVILILNKENIGFGAANNVGAAQANRECLFFLNPDTELLSDAIGAFVIGCILPRQVGISVSLRQVAGCGGRLIDDKSKNAVSFGNFPSLFQLISDVGFRRLYPRYYKKRLSTGCVVDFSEPCEVDYVSGANLFVRRDVFEEVGGFDEGFFMYFEEVDLARRLLVAGYRLLVVPSAKIKHYESISTSNKEGFNYHKYHLLEVSKYRYFMKQYGLRIVRFLKLLQIFTLAIHTLFTNQSLTKSIKITLKS